MEPRRIRVDEYHQMISTGILDEDDKVELLEGVIVAVSPQGPKHAFVIQRLNTLLVRCLDPGRNAVLPQLPVTLGDVNEPEPDIAVIPAAAASLDRHPSTALLIVEVAGDSLAKDRRVKAAVYARFAIPEYWIVNLKDETIEVHRDPDAASERYRTVLTFGRGQELRSLSVPEVTLRIDQLLA
jgi:Uma2 family endonuclease